MKGIWETDATQTWPLWQDIRDAGCNRIYFPALVPVYGETFGAVIAHRSLAARAPAVRRAERHFGERLIIGWTRNERQVTADYRNAVVSTQRFQYGVYRDPHWDGIQDPNTLAQLAHLDIVAATGGNKFLSCSFMFDIEFPYRDGDWLLAVFKAFRMLRPGRLLSWTMEPMQGGWIKSFPALVNWINRDLNAVVVGQTFGAKMEPVDPELVRRDLIDAGFLPARVRLFLDAAKPRPPKWDGSLFHAQRLRLAF